MSYQNWNPMEGNDSGVMAAGLTQSDQGTWGWADWPPVNRPIAGSGLIQGQSRCVGFVVEWDAPTPTPPQPPAPEVFNGHRYLVVTKLLDWNAAKAEAEAMGGHLLTINSAAERDWVHQNLWPQAARFDPVGRFYFGASAASPAAPWQWVTGEPIDMSLWFGARPDNGGGGRLVANWGDLRWDDVAPTWKVLPFVVEWDSLP